MKFLRQAIPDVVVIEPIVHIDSRGYFVENFRQDVLESKLGFPVRFVQDNESKSSRGVLRGLHFQVAPNSQGKLIRVIEGAVLDVAVDIRVGSGTFGQYVSVEISSDNRRQMFVPRGFAHGFIVLSETATFAYKVDNYYSPDCERGLAFDDGHLNIDWKIDQKDILVSGKDKTLPSFFDLPEYFNITDKYDVSY